MDGVVSIGWYRWAGAAALVAAAACFLTAVALELSAPGSPQNAPYFWAAAVSCIACFLVLPLLLWRAIRVRRLVRKQWRLVLMRAVWGGPFGTLGALWDLCSEPPVLPEVPQ